MAKNDKKFRAEKKYLIFFGSKIAIYLYLASLKDIQATGEALNPPHFKI
jgi:hypothetical protein